MQTAALLHPAVDEIRRLRFQTAVKTPEARRYPRKENVTPRPHTIATLTLTLLAATGPWLPLTVSEPANGRDQLKAQEDRLDTLQKRARPDCPRDLPWRDDRRPWLRRALDRDRRLPRSKQVEIDHWQYPLLRLRYPTKPCART